MTNTISFKAGDRVRLTSNIGSAAQAGAEAEVTKSDPAYTYVVWDRTNGLAREQMDGGYLSHRFELVPAKAIAPKTKRTAEFKKGGRCDQLLNFLTTGRTITQGEAIVLGFGTRLAATVHDLRGAGHNVVTSMKEDCHGNPYAEYRLVTRKANGDRKAA
nr:helix-turn-helix domain-containing protein [Methylobacterium sp. ZNC0032]